MDLKLPCEPCKQRDIDSTASTFCTTCQELQCKICSEVHKSFKATRTHLLVHIEEYQASAKLSEDLQVVQTCAEHNSKQIEYYCSSHKELLCSVCLLTKLNHKNCKTIVQLSSWASDAKKGQFDDKIFDDLNKVILKAKYIKKQLQVSYHNSMGAVKQMSDRLDNIRENFIALFEEQKSQIIKHVEETVCSHTDQSKQMLKSIGELITSAEECEQFLQEIIVSGRDSDVFHCLMLTIDKMENLKMKTEETRQQSSAMHITFENTSITQAIEAKIPVINYKLEETKLDVSNVPLKTASKEDLYGYISKCNSENKNKEASMKSEVVDEVRGIKMGECISENIMDVKSENENIKSE